MARAQPKLYERVLSVAQMYDVGVFHRGPHMLWTCRWTEDGKESSVGYEIVKDADNGRLGLRLRYKVFQDGLGAESVLDYAVAIRTSPSYRDKDRTWYWLNCPLTMNGKPCRRRVRNLHFLPSSSYFGCKHCRDLVVGSLTAKAQRAFRRTQFIDERTSVTGRHGMPAGGERGWRPPTHRHVCPKCACLSEGALCCSCGRRLDGTDHETFFEILGVAAKATANDIRIAFKTRLKEYHPDRVAHLGSKLQKVAEEEIKQVNLAYDTLRDPARRQAYVRELTMEQSDKPV